MRAVVCDAPNSYRIEEVETPEPAPDEVLVAVDRVQLSVTECRLYRGQELVHSDSVKRRLRRGPAQLFGHEFCGVVTEAGPEVEEFSQGDRVYAPGKIYCSDCEYCDSGMTHLCPNKVQVGYDRPGALAEYVVLPEEPLAALPDDVSDAEGAAMQPFAHAVVCMHEAGVRTGDVVAVVGTGVMGNQIGQLALQRGASWVFAIDVVDRKLEIAEKQGMIPLDSHAEDPVERVRHATNGVGADVVFEAVGGQQSHASDGDDPLAQAFRMVRMGGSVVQVGHITDDVTLEPQHYRARSVDWINPSQGTSRIGPNTYFGDVAPRLVSEGRVSLDEFVTHELDGLESFEEAVELTLDREVGLGPAQIIVSE